MNGVYPFLGGQTAQTYPTYTVPAVQQTIPQPINPVMNVPRTEIPRVSGEESIRSYPMGPNSSMIFVSSDPNSDLGWVVTTDSAAYKSIVPCHIIPVVAEEPLKRSDFDMKFKEIDDHFSKLEERMNSLNGQYGSKSSWSSGKSGSGSAQPAPRNDQAGQ